MSQFIEMFSGAPKVGINNLVDTVWGSSPDSKTYNDIGEGMPFYQGKTEFGDLYINAPVTYCTAPIKMAKANAILMSVRAPVGAVNIATQDCCIGRGLASITPKEGKSTTMFVYYALKYMEADIDRLGTGSTFKAINKESYAKIQMPNAKISEQAKFVSIAEQADKSEFVGCKSQFIEMFKGDNQVPLGDICNIEKGATITRNDVLPGEVPVVAGGQEPSCYHNVANREAGAITVSASGAYAGYINFWNCPIFASDCNTIISKDDEKTDQTFVYFGLRVMQKQIYGLQKGGAQPHVYGKDLQKFMFPCPSYAKQIEFSKMAKQADKSEYYN
ncbi:restriction endonuclease subunit S [Bacteroides caccae]|uniref:restriction endonuclease subunit S n=1 Tax=Bacteroides caccae TaxID=47678 RepID=UPI0035682AF0